MRRFLPFPALLAQPDKKGSLADIVTPPFDELFPAYRQELHTQHKHNFVRFESLRQLPGDKDAQRRVERALAAYQEASKAGKIVKDKKPHYYLMEVSSGKESLTGFLGMFQIESDPAPHMAEMAAETDIDDREMQLATLGAQTGPVTMGYRCDGEQAGMIREIKEQVMKTEPFLDFTIALRKRRYRLWRVKNDAAHEIEPLLARREMYVLDGMDRWKAAMRHAHEAAAADPTPSPFKAYNFVLAWLVNMNTQQIRYSARHRAVRAVHLALPPDDFLEQLEDHFEIERFKLTEPGAKEAELVNILDEMALIGKLQHTYGLYLGDKAYYLLFLRNADAYERMLTSQNSRRWKRLDVTILHTLVVEKLLDISWHSNGDLDKLIRPISPKRCVSLVDDGYAGAGFLLNPPPLDHIIEIAESDEEMPPQSTVLHCRPCAGAVMAATGAHDYVGDL